MYMEYEKKTVNELRRIARDKEIIIKDEKGNEVEVHLAKKNELVFSLSKKTSGKKRLNQCLNQ